MKIKRIHILMLLLLMSAVALPFKKNIRQALSPVSSWIKGRATIDDRLKEYGTDTRSRLRPHFEAAGVSYPPVEIVLVGLKDEKLLEVWSRDKEGDKLVLIRSYPILKTSGELGPKLQEGDMQVPEGVYRVESLNPNSSFHLSLRLNYPNQFDLDHAKDDGRMFPGSDIMIHGRMASVGCLAMGDETIEDLFVMVADANVDSVKVVLAPVDFRKRDMPEQSRELPSWVDDLYAKVRGELELLTM